MVTPAIRNQQNQQMPQVSTVSTQLDQLFWPKKLGYQLKATVDCGPMPWNIAVDPQRNGSISSTSWRSPLVGTKGSLTPCASWQALAGVVPEQLPQDFLWSTWGPCSHGGLSLSRLSRSKDITSILIFPEEWPNWRFILTRKQHNVTS